MASKIHVVFNAYNEKPFAKKCLEHIYPYVDSIAISDVAHDDGYTISNDGTHEDIIEFKNSHDNVYYRPQKKLNGDYKHNQGVIKTELMNMCNPSDSDWIFILEADEFYPEYMLKDLKSRYILNHQILSKQDIRWIVVPQMEFIYKEGYFTWSWSGRFFKYKKGANFEICNKFKWNNTMIYDDKYRWDLPPQYGYCYHLKYIKPLKRLKKRYGFTKNPSVANKIHWLNDKYLKYYDNPEKSVDSDLFKTQIMKLSNPYPKEIKEFLV